MGNHLRHSGRTQSRPSPTFLCESRSALPTTPPIRKPIRPGESLDFTGRKFDPFTKIDPLLRISVGAVRATGESSFLRLWENSRSPRGSYSIGILETRLDRAGFRAICVHVSVLFYNDRGPFSDSSRSFLPR